MNFLFSLIDRTFADTTKQKDIAGAYEERYSNLK